MALTCEGDFATQEEAQAYGFQSVLYRSIGIIPPLLLEILYGFSIWIGIIVALTCEDYLEHKPVVSVCVSIRVIVALTCEVFLNLKST